MRFYAFFGILMHTGEALFSAKSSVSCLIAGDLVLGQAAKARRSGADRDSLPGEAVDGAILLAIWLTHRRRRRSAVASA